MQYRRFGNTIAVRMDREEEVLEQLKKVSESEQIKLAQINAIGAIKEFTIGVYDVNEQKYYSNDYEGLWEIVSLSGNITTKEGEFYAHIHLVAGAVDGTLVGGHLNRAIVSATCEMFIHVMDGTIERVKDPEIGLNVFKFV